MYSAKNPLSHLLISAALLAVPVTGASAGTGASAKLKDQPDLHGIWQSDGYGYAVTIDRKRVALFHVTDSTCVKDAETAQILQHYLQETPPKIRSDGQRAEFSVPLENYTIAMDRRDLLPQICDNPTPDTPHGNFDAFVSYFTQHYAFFELYNIDWPNAVSAAREKISDTTSDEELFEIFRELIRPIRDGHVSLKGTVGKEPKLSQPNPGFVKEKLSALAKEQGADRKEFGDAFLEKYWINSVGRDILRGKGKIKGENYIQYGMASDTIGYIGFLTVAGFDSGDLFREQDDMDALNRIMDSAFAKFEKSGARAVIIDASTNFGGYDFISRAIAGRFAAKRALAYTKYAADSSITAAHPEYVVPFKGRRFEGPVYILTSDATVSGGEVLTLAIRALPNGTHAGQSTRGAFSDVLEKRLPNGWTVSLSNEVYADAEGTVWEGKGIQPELPIDVFSGNDLVASHARAVRTLIAYAETEYGEQNTVAD